MFEEHLPVANQVFAIQNRMKRPGIAGGSNS
ncbi:hypothetical protein ABIB06_003891 [Bradyrhizobium sp. LB8.2]